MLLLGVEELVFLELLGLLLLWVGELLFLVAAELLLLLCLGVGQRAATGSLEMTGLDFGSKTLAKPFILQANKQRHSRSLR